MAIYKFFVVHTYRACKINTVLKRTALVPYLIVQSFIGIQVTINWCMGRDAEHLNDNADVGLYDNRCEGAHASEHKWITRGPHLELQRASVIAWVNLMSSRIQLHLLNFPVC